MVTEPLAGLGKEIAGPKVPLPLVGEGMNQEDVGEPSPTVAMVVVRPSIAETKIFYMLKIPIGACIASTVEAKSEVVTKEVTHLVVATLPSHEAESLSFSRDTPSPW